MARNSWSLLLLVVAIVAFVPGASAFGAGNIPSIAQVEGHNWRHGDIEDMLKTIAFLHGKKWTTLLVQRTYFGNWLRDYSQAVDVGSLKGVNAPTIRILVWVLSFLAFGYATEEFEVTEERLGVYRPEEHIDNPKGYADGEDARKYDARLRGPIDPRELEIDMETGMKNYIANERGGWATSAGYLRFSLARSMHFGRVYLHGGHGKSGREADLCEALRCLGQSLHCMEDFSAHSNYCELALRELGYHDVFPHCGVSSQINVRGHHVYPLVTGTFGGVDFLHSVLGEANDHFTQSEVDEVDIALKSAEQLNRSGGGGGDGTRGLFGSSSGGGGGGNDFISLVGQLPGIGGSFAQEAARLQSMSAQQDAANVRAADNQNHVPGMSDSFDPVDTARKIYPILEFRDKIVRSINNTISKVPGLEKLLEHISETLTAFVLGLLAPFVRPIINSVSKVLKDGSSGVISASAHTQLEPWTDPYCTDPTHSMLSKDHFTNILNSCAGRVAATVLQYAVPRLLYAWDNPGVPVDEVVNDILRALHHPTLRNERIQIQRDMFDTVRRWANEYPRRNELNHLLSSQSVKDGHNHVLANGKTSNAGAGGPAHAAGYGGGGGGYNSGGGGYNGGGGGGGGGGHSHGGGNSLLSTLASIVGNSGGGSSNNVASAIFSQFQTRDMNAMDGRDGSGALGYGAASTPTSPAPALYASAGSPSYGYSHTGTTVSYNAATPSGGAADSYMRPTVSPGLGREYGQYGSPQQHGSSGGSSSYGQHQHGSGGGSNYGRQQHQSGSDSDYGHHHHESHHHHQHDGHQHHQHQGSVGGGYEGQHQQGGYEGHQHHQHQQHQGGGGYGAPYQQQPPQQGYYGGPAPPPGLGGPGGPGGPGGFYGGPPPPGWGGGPGGPPPPPGYGGGGGGYSGFQGGQPQQQPYSQPYGQQPYGQQPYNNQQQQGWGQPYQRY